MSDVLIEDRLDLGEGADPEFDELGSAREVVFGYTNLESLSNVDWRSGLARARGVGGGLNLD